METLDPIFKPADLDDQGAAAELAPETPPEAPKKRGRGRPSNAERDARGESVPPPRKVAAPKPRTARRSAVTARTAADYAAAVDNALKLLQSLAGMLDPVDAVIIEAHRPDIAAGLGQLAAENPMVGGWLDKLATSSTAALVLAPTVSMLLAIAAHHGLLRRTPFADSAAPYEREVYGPGEVPPPPDAHIPAA